MTMVAPAALDRLRGFVEEDGYVFVAGAPMRAQLERHGALSDWEAFADSWNDLAVDTYMADLGRYRRRRHAVFAAANDAAIASLPHQPHYQAIAYNPLNGGVARWFEPILPQFVHGTSLATILAFCRTLFGELAPTVHRWLIEVHQFRIEARAGEDGQPTPEGVHRDGVDFVLVLLIRRHNIVSGTTTIHAPDRHLLGAFTLTEPFDAALVDDARVCHGVTPVQPYDTHAPAYRDVLVVTFRRNP